MSGYLLHVEGSAANRVVLWIVGVSIGVQGCSRNHPFNVCKFGRVSLLEFQTDAAALGP